MQVITLGDVIDWAPNPPNPQAPNPPNPSQGLSSSLYNYQAYQTSEKETVSELRLLRVILERLECSFARQEAKLDKLLNSQTSPCLEGPVSQRQQQSSATPSPHLNGQSTLSQVERFLEEPSTSGKYLTVIFLMFTLQRQYPDSQRKIRIQYFYLQ